MKTFRQDQSGQLKANLKTAAKNTMRAVVKAGKELPKHISKGVVVAVAAFALATPNAQAQNLLDRIVGVMETVEDATYKVSDQFRKFNRAAANLKRANNELDYQVSETDRHLGGALSTGVNMVKGAIDRKVSGQIIDAMEQQSVGTVPLIAEEHTQTVSGGQRVAYSNSTNSANPTGLNVVGEVSLDELMARSRGNTTVSGNAAVSSATSQSFTSTSGDYTLEELAAYNEARSSRSTVTTVKAKHAALQSQKTGDVSAKTETKKTEKKSTEELYQQMVQQGYISR